VTPEQAHKAREADFQKRVQAVADTMSNMFTYWVSRHPKQVRFRISLLKAHGSMGYYAMDSDKEVLETARVRFQIWLGTNGWAATTTTKLKHACWFRNIPYLDVTI